MSLNGAQLSTLLKTYLHNDAGISSSDLLLYLTLGQQKMVRDSPTTLSTKQANISLTSGDTTREYDLPADFYQMQAVWLPTMGYKLSAMLDAEFIDTVERLPTIPTGPPRDYIIIGYDETVSATGTSTASDGIFNVQDSAYGAEGDGIVDDTAAIQAATDAAKLTGGVVYFPPGTYLINGTITVAEGYSVTFKGVGYGMTQTIGSFLKKTTTGKMFNANWSAPGSNDLVLFEDLFLYGGASAEDAAHIGIYASNVHGLRINRCLVDSFGGHGISIANGWGARIGDTLSTNNGLSGILLFRQCNNVILRDSAFNGNCRGTTAGYGNIHIVGDTGNTYIHDAIEIRGCDAEGAAGTPFGVAAATAYGIAAQDVYGLKISGGHYEENLTNNINIFANVKACHIGGGMYVQTQNINITDGASVTMGPDIYYASGAKLTGIAL